MSSEIAISVRGISKSYSIYESPVHRLFQSVYPRAAAIVDKVGARQLAGSLRERKGFREFHALHDVSFELRRGETVGIVGRNGSGKSTLLQMIAGTLTPTRGEITVAGRVAALLELGSGFNPDFTGLENIRLNATVLGLTPSEIDQRMDAILAFADIGDFVKRPVKTYSSGMVVRLAFAVQAQVEPDVLIVDEALSVGDAKFQSKCFARLHTLKSNGTSILFVSHSTEQIVTHCDRAILLHDGRVHQDGIPKDVVHTYLDLLFGKTRTLKDSSTTQSESKDLSSTQDAIDATVDGVFEQRANYNPYEYRWGDRAAEITDFRLTSPDGQEPSSIESGTTLRLAINIQFNRSLQRPIFGLTIKTKDGVTVYGTNTELAQTVLPNGIGREGTQVRVVFDLETRLGPGDYFLSLGVASHNGEEVVPHDRRYDSIHLNVHGKGFFGLTMLDVRIDAQELPQ
ncbi:ABC transporter ATP-binding protein [Dyella sp. GSA-30]|uniref:ABC transporter ATP-binding protein n=1 Tax=Dyella sp. GSA-30 TaxID=2994496 RepID=UPI00248FBA63|nr:ABC transporter ATP-binding protein [Dyella sp. GSA-30]BDU20198.1 sugar ABC transporter ATP-binding protein [Dyella sp. GSA-30]